MAVNQGWPQFGEAWQRMFQEMMAGSSPMASPMGTMPPAWRATSNPASWFGMGTPPSWGNFSGGFTPGMGSAAPNMGPMSGLFEQVSSMAQQQWQQLASQFVGGKNTGEEALSAWRSVLASTAPSAMQAFSPLPMADMSALRETLSTPQVGPMREHAERWQKAMLAQLDYQEAARQFAAQMNEIMSLAQGHFRQRLEKRQAEGKPAATLRELFDEWVEAGETAWAERASGDAFVTALGAYSNAEMRVKAAQADQLNRVAESLGLPTKGEVDADHRRIAQLERELRRVKQELAQLQAGNSRSAATPIRPASQVAPARSQPVAKVKKSPFAPASRLAAEKATTAVTVAATNPVKAPASKVRATQRKGTSAFPVVAAPAAIGKGNRPATSRKTTTSNRSKA